MKKTSISLAVGALMAASGAVNAATLVAGQNYTINVLADGVSCFTFGNCSTAVAGSVSYLVDNDNDALAAGASTDPSFGSAIAGDGLAGFMNISTTSDGAGGVNFTVSSFNMDTYNGTAGGQFATGAYDTSGMTGSVDASGNISLDLTGRMGVAQFFAAPASLGIQPWNTGATHTSGSQTNAVGTLFGAALAMDGTAKVISADLVGAAWGFFVGTPYTEVFSLQFVGGDIIDGGTTVIPVPAAAWLLGSGLIGLVGVARRKTKQA